ncbi:MAG TPA: hypothetical protein VFM58_06590 [Solirubrobacteraceae bacterium]|nr:hypothetical protein [Solirubrobacteraceae bacterium]
MLAPMRSAYAPPSAVRDPVRRENACAVRSSMFTRFEWFLPQSYGMKLTASSSFTAGPVERRILSLVMG